MPQTFSTCIGMQFPLERQQPKLNLEEHALTLTIKINHELTHH